LTHLLRAVLAFLLLAATPVQATIIGTTGGVDVISPPALLQAGTIESDNVVRVFAEQQGVLLESIIAAGQAGVLIGATQPGTYSELTDLDNGLIGKDEVVSSYRLFFDKVGGSLNPGEPDVQVSGSITFDEPIAGVAVTEGGVGSILGWQALLGLPGTTYFTGAGGFGGLELGASVNDGPDQFTISADRKTLTFSLTNRFPYMDNMTIITAVPEPTALALLGLALVGGRLARRRRVLLASAAAVALVAGPAAAQELEKLKHTTPEERATVQTNLMKEKLELTDAQLPKVREINLETAKKMDPVIKGTGGRFERLTEARQIGEAKDAQLKEVLTPSG
jgi:hypothetical protein